jgi:hypothetical protein
VRTLVDGYIVQGEQKLAQLQRKKVSARLLPGERFAIELGDAMYRATLDFLRTRRADIEQQTLQAAE